MILTLHNLAETYKMLPSEALTKATTFDLYVLDCHLKHIRYMEAKAQGKDIPKPSKKLSQEEMLAMIERVRNNQQGA